MKTICLLTAAILFSISVSAQETGKQKKSREEKAAEMELKFRETQNLLDSACFVLEADYLGNGFYRVPVLSTINFIMVDSASSVIQTGRNFGLGYNGVGGVTVEGSITKYTVRHDNKRKSFYVSWNVSTAIGFYYISMQVTASGRATATLTGNSAGRLIYEGWLVPVPASGIYKGSRI